MSDKNLPVSWEDRLAKFATAAVEQESSVAAGSFIGTKAGQLSYQGNPIQGNKLDVIIGDFIFENQFYEEEYDSSNPTSPVCYAFSHDEETLAPHPDSAKPQAKTCAECPNNEWGSDPKGGRGKACKNVRRLGVIPAKPLTAEALEKAEAAYLKLPVTSVKGWASYVRTLSAIHKRPAWAVVTQIGTVPDPKSQFRVTFEHMLDIPTDLLDICDARSQEVGESIEFPYSKPEPREERPKKARKF